MGGPVRVQNRSHQSPFGCKGHTVMRSIKKEREARTGVGGSSTLALEAPICKEIVN